MTRESDINQLIKGVFETVTIADFDSSGFTNDYCPFCHVAGKLDVNSYMNDIKHESNCVWLIAKDLLTVR